MTYYTDTYAEYIKYGPSYIDPSSTWEVAAGLCRSGRYHSSPALSRTSHIGSGIMRQLGGDMIAIATKYHFLFINLWQCSERSFDDVMPYINSISLQPLTSQLLISNDVGAGLFCPSTQQIQNLNLGRRFKELRHTLHLPTALEKALFVSFDEGVSVYDIEKEAWCFSFGLDQNNWDVSCSTEGVVALTGNGDRITLYDLRTRRSVESLGERTEGSKAVQFCGANRLASTQNIDKVLL